jgi:molecular chaperone GrpE
MTQKPNDDILDQDGQQLFEEPERPNEQEQRITDLTAALQRERADAENLRRRHGQQLAQLEDSATADVVRQLLPVIDNIERALSHIPEDQKDSDFVKGVQGVAKQFATSLEKLGVKRIETVGQPFDPHLHEAVSTEEGDGEEAVSEELQAGYKIGENVIRHAMVKVRT